VSIFGRIPWRNIRTDTACAPNEDSSNDILNHPIVESVVRNPHICMVYRRCEVFCVPVYRNTKWFDS